MATDVASADAEQRPESDTSSKALKETPEGTAATGTTAAGPASALDAAGAGTLGERQVQGKAASGGAVVGAADDPAERKADEAADRVMRKPDPVAVEPAPAAPGDTTPPQVTASPPGNGAEPPVQRKEGSSDEQRLPGAAPATPATTSGSAAPSGAPPETTTPAGAAAGAGMPDAGIPEPAAEPPAPEGEQPARETPRVPTEVQEYLDASRGKGAPLPEKARRTFETKFQRPLDDVRLHDDGSADDAARKLDALAFTRGNDIYFRAGAYDPESQEGQRLLAHELAHVVQQRPGVNRRKHSPGLGGTIVRRANGGKGTTKADDKTPPGTEKKFKNEAGEIDLDGPSLRLEKVRLPLFKVKHHTGTLTLKKTERSGGHAEAWSKAAASRLVAPLRSHALGPKGKQQKEPFYLQHGKTKKATLLFVGSAEDIAPALSRLPWDKEGKPHTYQIDHKKELQLGGPDLDPENLWLLDASINMSSGSTIKAALKTDIEAFLAAARPKLVRTPSFEEVRTWADKVTFGQAVADTRSGDKAPKAVTAGDSPPAWELKDLETATMDPLESMSDENLIRTRGRENDLTVFSRRGGGRPRVVTQKDGKITPFYGPGYKIVAGEYLKADPPRSGQVGTVDVAFFEGAAGQKKPLGPVRLPGFPIVAMSGVDYGGLLDTTAIQKVRNTFQSPGTSPVSFDAIDFDLDEGLSARGKIPKPSIRLLENVQIDVFVTGDDAGLEATITGGALKLPGPFKVLGGVLVLTASMKEGLNVEGQIDFEIQQVAKGYVKGSKGTSAAFELEGRLDFDTKMFTKAALGLSYKGGKWGVTGELEVGPGKIKGIKRAAAKVEVLDETITAVGEFEPSLKGVDKGTVGFRYNEATGAEITGEILFGSGVPGVKSGKLAATIRQGKEGYSLSGAVTVEPAVPGLTGAITGSYEDGGFLVEAELGYERGRAKGTVKIGVTNQPVGADGKPAGPPNPDGALIAYGGGSVTLTITPWLQGTVGLQLKPNGEIEVTGAVRLPSSFEVFPEKRVERQIFSIGIDIPIIGVAVAGQRIGIFATIRGGMSITAGFGPGQLRDVGLTVTYNPDHPDDTTVTGTGTFYVPAAAALRLTVDGGLGAGIPIVSATAGVSVYGEIGVAGAASAGAVISWTPIAGIVMDARGEIFVEPKFRFGIDAFVDVSADLWITTIELYHKKWSLASFEYGSNLRFGLMFPLHYESGKPFDLSFDQIQWTYPQIEPGELLGGLMKQLVG
jgi:hypothetical protein